MHYLSVQEVKEMCYNSTYHFKEYILDQKEVFPYNVQVLFDMAKEGRIRNESINGFVRKNTSRLHILSKEANLLTNTSEGFPIKIPKFPHFRTAEHLFQCIKLDQAKGDEIIEKQLLIIDQTSGEGAKLMGDRKDDMRMFWRSAWVMKDWEMRDLPTNQYKEKHWVAVTEMVNALWYALLMKLGNNRKEFGKVLLKNGAVKQSPIVEISLDQRQPDTFWGTKVEPNGMLRGMNLAGKLLSRLRDLYRLELLQKKGSFNLLIVTPPFSIQIIGGDIQSVDYNE
ncbi:NADAR family protein [Flammeovirga agarivorans]|uniref:NADAR family protein n=1 Tax=Flammeovirga agarivorans TaxID=2726742 RepID=A0A7X8SPK7_9BACT|nr:NADAR family protein [Flammeovirga agarivorans]NLR94029.1 NADAR family protein [Flammeovirga agarivorans]